MVLWVEALEMVYYIFLHCDTHVLFVSFFFLSCFASREAKRDSSRPELVLEIGSPEAMGMMGITPERWSLLMFVHQLGCAGLARHGVRLGK